jgi:hypothetical protein
MTKLPEPAYVTIRDYKEVNYYTHAQMLQFRRDALEEAAQYAESLRNNVLNS